MKDDYHGGRARLKPALPGEHAHEKQLRVNQMLKSWTAKR
jgi:hypothetical protein